MKITMTQSVRGSLDGVTVRDLIAGETYDTIDTQRGERLAQYHIKNGNAVAFVEVAAPATVVKPAAKPARAKK